MATLEDIGKTIGNAVSEMGAQTAKAAARANGISFASQNAQGNFNQASANNANILGDERLASQYSFNSGQALSANQFSEYMWDKAAAWNEAMMNRQMEFNAQQAQLNRDFQKEMRATSYQTARADMEKAGLNPILAIMGGGIGGSGNVSGSTASTSAPQMSSASGAMATGGLLNGISASEGNFTGQMEYMGGILGLLSTMIAGISSATSAAGGLGELGKGFAAGLAKILGETPDEIKGNKNPNRYTHNNQYYYDDKTEWESIPGISSLFKNIFK